MKKARFYLILINLLLFVNHNTYSQSSSKSIAYSFGDSVNYQIEKYLIGKNIEDYYCYFRSINTIEKRVYISKFHKVDMYRGFVKLNTRFLLIDNIKIPIIFDSDDIFSTYLNRKEKSNYGPDIIYKQTKTGGGFFVDFILNNEFEVKIINIGIEQ